MWLSPLTAPRALPMPGHNTIPPGQEKKSGIADDVDAQMAQSKDYLIIHRLAVESGVVEEETDALAQAYQQATGNTDTYSFDLSSFSLDVDVSTAELRTPGMTVSAQALELHASFLQAQVVQDGNGTSVQVSEVNIDISMSQVNLQANGQAQKADPLVLDLDGNGFQTSGLLAGVAFDIDIDGRLDRVSMPTGGDALLALDRDGNGRIDSGAELFGDQAGAKDGFAALAALDDNGDGAIDASDSSFAALKLLDYASGEARLRPLANMVSRLYLANQAMSQTIGQSDQLVAVGQYEDKDGRRGQMGDLLLSFDTTA